MPNFPSLLPRGSGGNRRGFEQLIKDIAAYYPKAYEEAYIAEVEILIADIIDHTPIETGAAAGVQSNSVGHARRDYYPTHKAQPAPIGNMPGDTGWQLEVKQDKGLHIAIVNPQWNNYLKFLELGAVNPLPPATSHFVFGAWKRHEQRRGRIRERIRRGRS